MKLNYREIRLYDIHDVVKVVPQAHREQFFRWIGDFGCNIHNDALLQLDLVEIYEMREEYDTPEWALECLKAVIDAMGDDASNAYIKYWW